MSDELFSVAGQNVLITGGSRGIGRAIAEGFAGRGATVVICSRSQESVDTAVSEMRSSGLTVDGLACDVSDEEQIRTTVGKAVEKLGHIAFMTGQTLYVDGGFSAGWSWPIPLS